MKRSNKKGEKMEFSWDFKTLHLEFGLGFYDSLITFISYVK